MSVEEITDVIHAIHEALMAGDREKALSFFTDNAVLEAPEGKFTGKEEIRRYFDWTNVRLPEVKFTEMNLVVDGNKASHEYIIEAKTSEGWDVQAAAVANYDFVDGQVTALRDYYDRLAMISTAKVGWVTKWFLGMLRGRMEKGL
jgi:ketosteroid isomerase-like protein